MSLRDPHGGLSTRTKIRGRLPLQHVVGDVECERSRASFMKTEVGAVEPYVRDVVDRAKFERDRRSSPLWSEVEVAAQPGAPGLGPGRRIQRTGNVDPAPSAGVITRCLTSAGLRRQRVTATGRRLESGSELEVGRLCVPRAGQVEPKTAALVAK